VKLARCRHARAGGPASLWPWHRSKYTNKLLTTARALEARRVIQAPKKSAPLAVRAERSPFDEIAELPGHRWW